MRSTDFDKTKKKKKKIEDKYLNNKNGNIYLTGRLIDG